MMGSRACTKVPSLYGNDDELDGYRRSESIGGVDLIILIIPSIGSPLEVMVTAVSMQILGVPILGVLTGTDGSGSLGYSINASLCCRLGMAFA